MTTPTRRRPAAQALTLALLAALALFALHQLTLPTPPMTDFQNLLEFLRTQGPLVTAAAGIRWLAMLGGAYVLAIALLALLASIGSPSPRLVSALRCVTVPSLRWLVPTVLGLGALTLPAAGAATPATRTLGHHQSVRFAEASTTTPGGPDDLVAVPEPTTTARDAHTGTATFSYEGSASPTSSRARSTTARPTTSARPSPAPSTAAPTTTTGRRSTIVPHHDTSSRLAEAPPAVAVSPPRPEPAQHPRTEAETGTSWTVRSGDHLWHIAEATLVVRGGAAPDEATTAIYWRRLIAANRDRLVDPSNPDLILPGQVFVLPET